MRNIFLIGFMGCGKSKLADAAAKEMGREVLDSDRAIEQAEQASVAEIFATRGERYFRHKETQLLKKLVSGDGKIVSCGGGMALSRENTDYMRQVGGIVFLDTPFDLCYGRIKNDPARPLAADKSQEALFELYRLRRMVYLMEADEVLSGADEIPEKIKNLQKLKELNRW